MRRALIVLVALFGLVLATGGSAEATQTILPAGCSANAPATITWVPFKVTLKQTEVTTFGITCTTASGWVVTGTRVQIQRNLGTAALPDWRTLVGAGASPVTSGVVVDYRCAITIQGVCNPSTFSRRGLIIYTLMKVANGSIQRFQQATATQLSS